MVDVTVEGNRVVFQVEGLDRLWALRSRLEIPVAHLMHIEHDPDAVGRWWPGFKLMGAEVPGLFAAGTFYYHGELVFWDVHDPAKTIIVSLDHERYKKLIVESATRSPWRSSYVGRWAANGHVNGLCPPDLVRVCTAAVLARGCARNHVNRRRSPK